MRRSHKKNTIFCLPFPFIYKIKRMLFMKINGVSNSDNSCLPALFIFLFFYFFLKKFRRRGSYPIPGSKHTKVFLRTYRESFSPFFFGFYRLPNKRDCQQRDSNLGLDSKDNDSYQLNLPSLAMPAISFAKSYTSQNNFWKKVQVY